MHLLALLWPLDGAALWCCLHLLSFLPSHSFLSGLTSFLVTIVLSHSADNKRGEEVKKMGEKKEEFGCFL